jgi:hypothetical protein
MNIHHSAAAHNCRQSGHVLGHIARASKCAAEYCCRSKVAYAADRSLNSVSAAFGARSGVGNKIFMHRAVVIKAGDSVAIVQFQSVDQLSAYAVAQHLSTLYGIFA